MIELSKLQPIDIWLNIAFAVQKFNIDNHSDFEKIKNVNVLRSFLANKGYIISNEIASKLVEDIYNLNTNPSYQKAYFLEQIYTLKDIKVSKIAYQPYTFSKNVINLTNTKANKKSIYITTAYTDGTFNIRKWHNYGFDKLSLINLENSSFVIKKIMLKDENRLLDVYAYLKNFNGDYPSLKEIRKFKQAKLITIESQLFKEKYEIANRTNTSCREELRLCLGKKQKHGQYYYQK